jgi:uncharacterized protein YecE (DUF72 family)
MSEIRIGVSGWSYREWRGGGFYPKGLPQSRELEFAAERVNSIEINATFYKLQTPASFRKWSAAAPDDLIFAIKGSKYITHQKKLNDIHVPLANFFASGLLSLGDKLGPILWQFPPWYRFSRERIEAFLQALPRTTRDAGRLAADNTIKNQANALVEPAAKTQLRYAFEPRHESFFCEEFVELLRRHNAALAFADSAGKWPYAEDLTADLVYIRLHGSTELYASDYSDEELAEWARKIKAWKKGRDPRGSVTITSKKFMTNEPRDVYVYFDNDIGCHAPYNAIHLAKLLGKK